MIYRSMMMLQVLLPFHKDTDGHTLLDIEDVFIPQSVWCALLFLTIAVQIEYVDFVEALHQTAAHAPERGIIKIAVIRDESENTMSHTLNLPLRKAHELDVVIAQPFRLGRPFQ